MRLFIVLAICFMITTMAHARSTPPAQKHVTQFSLKSGSFSDGELMPQRHSCKDEDTFEPNISPSLIWSKVLHGTKTFALLMDDPDVPDGTWDHWIVFNIPVTVTGFDEKVDVKKMGANVGSNSWGRKEYGGPCPPSGIHRYFFKLYALDKKLDLSDGATKKEVLDAMQGHILATAELMGRFAASGSLPRSS